MASSLIPSIVSLEYSSSFAMVCYIAWRLSWLISSGSVASSPYSSSKGVKPVVLEAMVLCDQTTFENSSTHLPLQRLNRVLDMAKNTALFAHSTAPLDSGW
jgi:hypothetical protein